MNIVFCVDSLARGGAGKVVSILASNMAKKGNNVSVVPVFDDRIQYDICQLVRVNPVSKGDVQISVQQRIRIIRDFCKKNDAEIVVAFLVDISIYVILASFFQRWKVIISERNDPGHPAGPRLEMARNILYRFADGFVFQTKDAKDYYADRIRNKSIVIFNPIVSNFIYPYTGQRSKRIVSVGRLVEQKNYRLAIDAFKEVHQIYPDYIYEIYGDGELKEELEQYIYVVGLSGCVKLMGQRKDVLNEIKDASLFLMTSKYEGMSNALIEALALGIPTISTDHPIGGARELIVDGVNGYLVPVNNKKELVYKMNYLLKNTDIGINMTSEAERFREKLDESKITDQWMHFMADL